MSSDARDDFLRAVAAFRRAADEPCVRASDDTGDLLRRGLTVAGYNILETFIAGRLREVAGHLNRGTTQFLDLPEALQVRAIRNTIEVAAYQARRMGRDAAILRTFSREIGASLTAVDRSLELSHLTWMWSGSNMSAGDYSAILKAFHVKEPWKTADALATRLGFPSPDLRVAIDDLARERHACAHEARHGVTALWLRSVPDRITAAAACFDVLVSISAIRLSAGDRAFLDDPDGMDGSSLRLRWVVDRGRDSAEMLEGGTRAFRTNPDGDALFDQAARRCTADQAVVAQSSTGDVTAWSVPAMS